MRRRPALGPNEAHVWLVADEAIEARPGLLAEYRRLLSPDEERRLRRLSHDRARREYLTARALCRTVLSRYADVDPGDWRFARNEHGRPEVSGPRGRGRLRFNLSGTRGLTACAVTWELDAGVDVEALRTVGAADGLADRFFSPLEARVLRDLPPARRRERFLEYWTLKESYIKATGKGLSIPLDRFSFHLDEGPGIRISFAPGIEDSPRRWQFALLRPTDGHVLALGVRRSSGAEVAVTSRETVPLRDAGAAPR
ncbi:MAG: 4'-phosphopantetheinyl transferase superfamily protein [Elusimicrobia bacterium]|nr:4'-phosphopantetheinyl transferase superfamily protein [Elusimicrobiota bacterium]